jgi:hypothetical protein
MKFKVGGGLTWTRSLYLVNIFAYKNVCFIRRIGNKKYLQNMVSIYKNLITNGKINYAKSSVSWDYLCILENKCTKRLIKVESNKILIINFINIHIYKTFWQDYVL